MSGRKPTAALAAKITSNQPSARTIANQFGRWIKAKLFKKADIDGVLSSDQSEAGARQAGQFLRRLYEERDEGWVYERAVTRLKRYYTFFHTVVVGILLVSICVVITSISGNEGGSLDQLLLAALSGALGATLAAAFKVRDTVARLNDLPAVMVIAFAQALIGATLGFVAWLLLRSGVFQIGGNSAPNIRWEELALVAFAAGFSEPFSLRLIDRLIGSVSDSH